MDQGLGKGGWKEWNGKVGMRNDERVVRVNALSITEALFVMLA